MEIIGVVPAMVWEHKVTGRHVSIHGSLPGLRHEWDLVQIGYTWKCKDHNGRITIGLGRPPAKTREEAVRVKRLANAKRRGKIRHAMNFYKPERKGEL